VTGAETGFGAPETFSAFGVSSGYRDTLMRFGFAALIVVAGAVLFGRTIRSSVRAPGG
jgi:hypothetical protein